MKEEKVFIPFNGNQLEGLLTIQEASPYKGGVLLCHPHPLYGGDMDNLVVTTASEVALQEGFSTLRFNFRGVGRSGGTYHEGIGEREDVLAVADYFHQRMKNDYFPLILVGYSFGAWVGLSVAVKDGRFKGMVAIAPPIGIYDFSFLKGCRKEKLFIAGDLDLFCPLHALEEWYQQIEDPKSLSIVPGADHFFFYHLSHLIQPLRGFFSKF